MDIGGGVFERIANTRLGTEMDDSVDPVVGKHFGERVGITEVDVDKGERLTVACLQMRNACMLEIDGIIGREIVDSDHRFAAIEQGRSEEHTSELQSLMRISYAVFCLKKKKI